MKKFWKCINGNKTLIGFVLLNLTQLTFMKNWLGADLVTIQAIIGALTGAALAHHIKKGDFGANKD